MQSFWATWLLKVQLNKWANQMEGKWHALNCNSWTNVPPELHISVLVFVGVGRCRKEGESHRGCIWVQETDRAGPREEQAQSGGGVWTGVPQTITEGQSGSTIIMYPLQWETCLFTMVSCWNTCYLCLFHLGKTTKGFD